MTRRGFLGSLLGTVASYPFFVRLPYEPLQIFEIPTIKEYSMWVQDDLNKAIIQAPGIELIQTSPGKIEIKVHKIEIVQTMKVTRAILFDNRTKKIAHEFNPFTQPVHAQSGDSLILTGAIEHTGDNLSLDEVLRRGIKR